MSGSSTPWSLPGERGATILGDAHVPGDARGTVIVAHGFKGYKDYGFIPVLASACAERGFVTHRFNFSHSGMTNRIETFEHPERFEEDSWNTQVHDLDAVIDAVLAGTLSAGAGPLVVIGHSRGGVSALLTAARRAAVGATGPDGVVTAATPATCNSLTPDAAIRLLAEGRLPSPSSRTGQTLYVGRRFIDEQRDNPAAFDLPRVVGAIACPVLVVHGDADETVPVEAAHTLGDAIGDRASVRIIAETNHVFGCANPAPAGAAAVPALAELIEAVGGFLDQLS